MRLENISNNKNNIGYNSVDKKQKTQEQSSIQNYEKTPVNSDYYKSYNGVAFKGHPHIDDVKNTEITKNVDLDGIPTTVKSYKKNDTEFFLTDDGKLYRVRYSKDAEKNAQTVLASKLYNLAGIKTPEMKVLKSGDYNGYISEYTPDVHSPTDNQAYYDEFGADAWLGNWNAYKHGNTHVDKDGNVVKLTTSGTLNYRATGKLKDNFSDTVDEINTFLDENKNPQSAQLLRGMTDEQKKQSIERVTSIKNNDIILAVQQSQIKDKQAMINKLIARKESLGAGIGVNGNNNTFVPTTSSNQLSTNSTSKSSEATSSTSNSDKRIKPTDYDFVILDDKTLPKATITPEEKQHREECLQKYLSGSWISHSCGDNFYNSQKADIEKVRQDIYKHPEKRDGYAELASYDHISKYEIDNYINFNSDRFPLVVKLSSYKKFGYSLPVNELKDIHKLDDIPLEKLNAIVYGMGLVNVDNILKQSNKSMETIRTVLTLPKKYDIEDNIATNLINFLSDETGNIPRYKLDLLDNLMNRDEEFKKPYNSFFSNGPRCLASSVLQLCDSEEKANEMLNEILPEYEKHVPEYSQSSQHELTALMDTEDRDFVFDKIDYFHKINDSKEGMEYEFINKDIDTREKLDIYKDLRNSGMGLMDAKTVIFWSEHHDPETYKSLGTFDYEGINFVKELHKKNYPHDLWHDFAVDYPKASEEKKQEYRDTVQRIDERGLTDLQISDRKPIDHDSYWADASKSRPLYKEEIMFLQDKPIEVVEEIKQNIDIPGRSNQFKLDELYEYVTMDPEKKSKIDDFGLLNRFDDDEFSFESVRLLASTPIKDLQKIKDRGVLCPLVKHKCLHDNYAQTCLKLGALSDYDWKKLKERDLFNKKGYEVYQWYKSGEKNERSFDVDKMAILAGLSDEDYKDIEDKKLFENYSIDAVFGYLDFKDYSYAKNIDELSNKDKRTLLKKVIKYNTSLFDSQFRELSTAPQFCPANKEEYCALVKGLVKSMGLKTKPISEQTKANFYNTLGNIENLHGEFMNTDFTKEGLTIDLEYPREKFMQDVEEKLADLSPVQRSQVTNYFGFELQHYKDGILRMNGYPVANEEYPDSSDYRVRDAIREIKPFVKQFSKDNKIIPNENISQDVANSLNDITKAFPEWNTLIGKPQHLTHSYTVDVHSINVLQNIMKNPKYRYLPEQDRRNLQIIALFHDLTKFEHTKDKNHPEYNNKKPLAIDKTHPEFSAYDTYHLLRKLDMPKAQRLQIYEIMKNHDFNEKYDNSLAKDYAFKLRQGNSFKMECILTEADLKSVSRDGSFYTSFGPKLKEAEPVVSKYVEKLQETSICLPQTKIPKASELVIDGVNTRTVMSYDSKGKIISNKVLYLSDNLDLHSLGFKENIKSEDLNVLVHALDEDEQSTVFQALGEIDSEALLSSSYVNYKNKNYHVFRKQGFVLDVAANDINAAYYRDFGSGYKKDLQMLERLYLFDGLEKDKREYVSNAIKKKLNLSDEEYKKLYPKIADKSISQLDKENPEVAQAMRSLMDDMEGGKRAHGREYNEILISRPKIQAVFFQGSDKDINKVPEFLRQYAQDNDVPIIYFGE